MNNKGFSLVELIIVIAIMAVLVGVLAPQFLRYVERGRQSKDVENFDLVRETINTYYADETNPPATWTLTQQGSSLTLVASDDTPLVDCGINQITLSSNLWTNVSLTYTPATNQWQMNGSATFFNADGSEVSD